MLQAQVQSLGREDSLEEETASHSSITCLENLIDRGAWWARVHGVAKSQTPLSDWACIHINSELFPLSGKTIFKMYKQSNIFVKAVSPNDPLPQNVIL